MTERLDAIEKKTQNQRSTKFELWDGQKPKAKSSTINHGCITVGQSSSAIIILLSFNTISKAKYV